MSEYAATISAQQSAQPSDDEQRIAPIVFCSAFAHVYTHTEACKDPPRSIYSCYRGSDYAPPSLYGRVRVGRFFVAHEST